MVSLQEIEQNIRENRFIKITNTRKAGEINNLTLQAFQQGIRNKELLTDQD